MKFTPFVCALVLLTLLSGCGYFMPKSSYTTSKAKVLKVYTTTDAGHNYISYVVDRAGTEVVVSDPLGKSSKKVGDPIEYLDQKIELRGGTKTLSFTFLK